MRIILPPYQLKPSNYRYKGECMNNEQRLNKLLKEQKELLEELDKETKGLNNNLDKIIEICDVFIKLNSVR